MENKFLAIDKRYFGTGLKSLDLLIIAYIEEFQRNGCECHITNQQFCELLGEDINAVKRSIKKLSDIGAITRQNSFVKGSGKGNRQRKLFVNQQWKLMVHSEPTNKLESSNTVNGRLKNEEWKVHNEPIKEKEKIIKDNIFKDHSEPTSNYKEKRIIVETEDTKKGDTKILDSFVSGDGLPGRRIRDLSDKEAKEIKAKIASGTQYQEIEQEYGMRSGTITKDFSEHWKMFLYAYVNNKL